MGNIDVLWKMYVMNTISRFFLLLLCGPCHCATWMRGQSETLDSRLRSSRGATTRVDGHIFNTLLYLPHHRCFNVTIYSKPVPGSVHYEIDLSSKNNSMSKAPTPKKMIIMEFWWEAISLIVDRLWMMMFVCADRFKRYIHTTHKPSDRFFKPNTKTLPYTMCM